MKRILVVLFSLICFIGYAQTPYPTPYTQQGSPSTLVQVRGGWKADSTAMMPKYVDTITANLYKTKLYAGSIIFTTGDGNYWYRSADAARWLLFGNSVTNCLGTQLISGSITWSGSGLIFDATDLEYSIICTRYSSSATTLTLSTADPTYARIDKLYADITGNVGVITGTPAPNPQEPVINPLSQLDMGIVYIPAGSTVPAGTTQTVIYNENVEWSGTSDVPSINFAYATNPYIGSLSTYIPSAPNSSYISWQYGTTKRFIDVQYLKLWVRINEAFVSRPSPFLDVSFYNGSTKVSADSYVEDGVYNFDFNLIGEWQLVSIPLQGLVVSDSIFDKVNFVIHSAPTSFQLDYVYLLETATVPPVIGNYWGFQGNIVSSITNPRLGTTSDNDLTIIAGDSVGIVVPSRGVTESSDTTHKQLLWDSTTKKLYWGYQPTILADAPLYIYTDANNKRHIADTSATAGGNCGLISGGEVTLIDSTTFNVSAALYCIGNVNYSSLDSVMTLVTPGDTVRIDVIGVDTSGSVFQLTGVESENPSIPSIDATYQLALAFVLVSTDSITPYNPTFSWNTNGNSGTNPYVNFLGTSDNKGFMIRTLGNRSGYIDRIHYSSSWGIEALNTNAGSNNNAIGYGAGFLNSTGSDNNYLGNAAGYTNTIGVRNTAIGGISNYANTEGNENVAIGYRSLQNNQASQNVAVGVESLQLNTDGIYNTAVGHAALNRNTVGTKNTALGHSALERNTTGGDNLAISYQALRLNTTGSGNVGIGLTSLYNNLTGSLNTSVGNSSGGTLITGTANTIVGANANAATSSTDSSGAFGALATASTRQMAFSPYFNTMFLNLDSASGTAPAIAGIDENGNWRKYATPAGGSSQWTDTTAGIYYNGNASVGVNAVLGSNSMAIGNNNDIRGVGSYTLAVGTGNIIIGQGSNVAFGEVNTIDTAEASSILYGYGNTIGAHANDAVAGGTSTNVYSLAGIGFGIGNEVSGEAGAAIGGSGNYANGYHSGLFASTGSEAEDTSAVAIGGQNNSASGVNAAIIGGENNATLARNTVILGGSSVVGTMANTTYVDSFRVRGKIVAPGLSTSGTYSKSLAIDASGNIYKKDTLAVSGVYAPLASPTFTGTVNLPATTFNGILSSTFNASFNNLILLGGLYIPKTITAGGTTGAQTINKPTGSVNFAAGATTLVVTNSYVSSTSLVIVQVYGTDVTATSARVTLATGSFTITLNAAATAETKVGFFVTN